jgi:hypothetical protein
MPGIEFYCETEDCIHFDDDCTCTCDDAIVIEKGECRNYIEKL